MRIATLNIRAGGGTRVDRLLAELLTINADILVLTEFHEGENSKTLGAALLQTGYQWQAASSVKPRENCVFVAARVPFVCWNGLNAPAGVDSHRLLLARFERFNLLGAYFPQNEAKRPVFDFLASNVERLLGVEGILLGDLNTGRHLVDESGKTFSCAECLDSLEAAGLVDSWRSRNPSRAEFSWYSNARNGFRLDHAFCTPSFDRSVVEIFYNHRPRETGATDHSALEIEIGV